MSFKICLSAACCLAELRLSWARNREGADNELIVLRLMVCDADLGQQTMCCMESASELEREKRELRPVCVLLLGASVYVYIFVSGAGREAHYTKLAAAARCPPEVTS
jgi:hypothetical protein